MANYLFIESRDPIADRTLDDHFRLMEDLVESANQVEVFLVQDAVLLGKSQVRSEAFDALLRRGVKVHADEFSLVQRGIATQDFKSSCKVSPISTVVEALESNCKVIWN